MNALFYFTGYHFRNNEWWRFAITVPDGYDDRHTRARDVLAAEYPELRQWSGKFICLTKDEVWTEL